LNPALIVNSRVILHPNILVQCIKLNIILTRLLGVDVKVYCTLKSHIDPLISRYFATP